jgi:hypothetical protein
VDAISRIDFGVRVSSMRQFLLCIGLAATCPALFIVQAQPDQIQTFGLFNGYAWNSFPSTDVQRIYLAGVSEALIHEVPDVFQKKYMAGNLTTADVQVLISNFYTERANLLIPIIEALHIVSMKTHGASQAEIDEEIKLWRGVASNAPEKNEPRR